MLRLVGGRLLWLALLLPMSLAADARAAEDVTVRDPSYSGVSYRVQADLVDWWEKQGKPNPRPDELPAGLELLFDDAMREPLEKPAENG